MAPSSAPNLAILVYYTVLDAGLPRPDAVQVAHFCASGIVPEPYAERCALYRALRKLKARLPAWSQANQRWARTLLNAQRNKPDTDPRPTNVRGVTPDWRAHPTVLHPTLVSAADLPLTSQARTWALSLVAT